MLFMLFIDTHYSGYQQELSTMDRVKVLFFIYLEYIFKMRSIFILINKRLSVRENIPKTY
jgi:hypothetical protein